MPQSRQLAAIMFTDIVGYTAMMGSDEQKAFELLSKNRQLQKPIIEQLGGRWIKELGDGVLACFPNASDAVKAAILIQQTCNASHDFQLRVGVHLGEVVFEHDDVFGDGVNIAARIQALATPGGIWISESVHKNVSNKIEINTEFVKVERLKNVIDPVHIYQVKMEGIESASPENAAGPKIETGNINTLPPSGTLPSSRNRSLFIMVSVMATALITFSLFYFLGWNGRSNVAIDKSIAVLPFTNMTEDVSQAYFCDGIMDEILNQLFKISDLKVSSRTSSMQYRGSKMSLKEIARELGVSYVLEGSVQKSGDRIRIITQLIDAETDKHLWSETYDKTLHDVFAVQTEISKSIASQLHITLSSNDREQLEHVPTTNPKAYDYYLKAKAMMGSALPKLQLVDSAIMLDSSFAVAYSLRALYTALWFFNKWPDYENKDELAWEYMDKAISLNPNLVDIKINMANVLYLTHTNYDEALAILEKLKIEYPKNSEIYSTLSHVQRRKGLWKQALKNQIKAAALNPNKDEFSEYARLQMAFRNYDWIIENNDKWGRGLLAEAWIGKGDMEKALTVFRDNGDSLSVWSYKREYNKLLQYMDKRGDYLRKNRFDYAPRSLDYAVIYYAIGNEAMTRKYAQQATEFLENEMKKSHGDFTIYKSLGLAYALAGNFDRAINMGQLAVQMSPMSRDAFQDGPLTEYNMSMIFMLCGKYDEGMDLLEHLLTVPSQGRGIYFSPQHLKLDSRFDIFRKFSRFEKMVNKEYKTVY